MSGGLPLPRTFRTMRSDSSGLPHTRPGPATLARGSAALVMPQPRFHTSRLEREPPEK